MTTTEWKRSLTVVPQSRRLSSRTNVDREWLIALFDFIDRTPRSAIYSMAFALTCVRTYDLSENNILEDNASQRARVAEFEVARELFDLLEDNINATDQLDAATLQRSRSFNALDFARTNDLYVKTFDETFLPIVRYCQAILKGTTDETTAVVGLPIHDREAYVANEISRVLRRVNEHSSLVGMRIPANARCSISTERIDSEPLNAAVSSSTVLHRVLSQRILPDNAVGGAIYTYFEAYVAYAPMVYRYESLNSLTSRWNERRKSIKISSDDEEETIRWILLPTRGVWQGGTSQIVWIVMHTLAALTVQRRNRYIHRFIALLERLSFYVWCAECSVHWSESRGDDYFRHVSSLPKHTLSKLPIDIILLRCHNTVNANSSVIDATATAATLQIDDRDGFASKWTLANLCLDYRDFVAVGLLRRGDRESARSHRAALCGPMVRAIERITGDAPPSNIEKDAYLLSVGLTDSGMRHSERFAESPIQELLLAALRQQHGEMLLRKLWYDIDHSTTVPICAMY